VDLTEFWKLIESARDESDCCDDRADLITAELVHATHEYQGLFDRPDAAAYSADL